MAAAPVEPAHAAPRIGAPPLSRTAPTGGPAREPAAPRVSRAPSAAPGCDIPGLSHVDVLTCRVIKQRATHVDWTAPAEERSADDLLGTATYLGQGSGEPINAAITILIERDGDCPRRELGSAWAPDRMLPCQTIENQLLYEDLGRQILSRAGTAVRDPSAGGTDPADPAASP